jgi:hypothetical protein
MSPLFGMQILEMSRLEMGLIRIYVGVQLEGEDNLAVGQNGRDREPQARAGAVRLAHPPPFRRDKIAQVQALLRSRHRSRGGDR